MDLLKNITNCHFMVCLPLQDELIRDSLGKKRSKGDEEEEEILWNTGALHGIYYWKIDVVTYKKAS